MNDAPTTSTYLLQTPDMALTNAQALSSLSGGILKNTGTALAIASSSSDYTAYNTALHSISTISVALGDMLVGQNDGTFIALPIPETPQVLHCDGVHAPAWAPTVNTTAAYLLTSSSGGDSNMTNRRVIAATTDSGILLTDNGAGNTFEIGTTGYLGSLMGLHGGGIVVRRTGGDSFLRSVIGGDSSIVVTNGNGNSGDISLIVNPNTTTQLTAYALNGIAQTVSSTLNFVTAPGVDVSLAQVGDATNITLRGSTESDTVDFVTLTDYTDVLENSFPLSALATGLMKVTTTTGVITTATPGTDYLAPSANLTSISSAAHTLGELLVGSGTAYAGLGIGSTGQVLTVAGGTAAWATPTTPAPTTSTYIVKTADVGLPNAFALSTLSTGLLKVTTTTGALTTASAGTDYLAPSANLTSISSATNTTGELLVGNSSGFVGLGIGSTGQVLTVAGGTASWETPTTPAPTTSTYILNTADAGLPSAFALSTLSTGLLKVTTTTGALTTASAGTDYVSPSANLTALSSASGSLGNLLVANGTTYATLGIGSTGDVLTVAGGTAAWSAPTVYAPSNGSYITQTPESGLSSEFALSGLATGSLRVTTSTGALTSYTPTIFVKCVADGTLPAYTYAGGVITFTANGAIGPEYTDNVSTSAADIVFNNDYAGANAAYLGAYTITTKGDGGTQEVWTRVSTFNSSTNMVAGIRFIPSQGTVYANSDLTFTTTGAITVGTTPLTFMTDAFTRSWSFAINTIDSTTVADTLFFNLPFGKVFYPTAIYVTGATQNYTSIPYYFDGSTPTVLGTPLAITGAADNTEQYTLTSLFSGTGIPTIRSAASGTQAGLGIDVTVGSIGSDLPTYTIVGKWSKA